MNNLYNRIYEAADRGVQKALIISDEQSQDTSVIFHNKEISTNVIPYKYRFVNLELPSGLLWAEYNLGAEPGNMASDWYGDNYAWGETEIKSDYSWESYKHCDEREKLIKYNTNYNSKEADGLSKLKSQDDVVSVTLGKQYRMPTKKELNELLKYTTHEWVTDYNGVNKLNGMLFISKNNNNTLFFPASVYFNSTFTDDMIYLGYIWSSSLYTEDPYAAVNLYFDKDTIGFIHSLRCYGYSIRAVKK